MKPVLVIAAHKPCPLPDNPLYLPVQAGSLNKESIGYQRDDEGQSISDLNSSLSELTVLYWAWKNLPEDVDAFGLVHYRRFFKGDVPIEGTKAHVLSFDQACRDLMKHDILVPKKRNYYIETLESHYAHTHQQADLVLLKEIMHDLHPECDEILGNHLKKTSGHMFNIFLMKRELANSYCEFLFEIVFEILKRSSLDQADAFNARMPGRLSEFLLDVWLEKENLSYHEIGLVSTTKVNWLKKGTAFLKAKFFNKKYSASFK